MADNTSIFYKITNKEVYSKLLEVEQKLSNLDDKITKMDGRLRLAKWIAGTSLTLTVSTTIGLVLMIARWGNG